MTNSIKQYYFRFRDSTSTPSWLIRIAIFYVVGVYGWLFVLRHVTGNIHLSLLDPLQPYVEHQFLGSAFGRITKLIFILLWYAIWVNTIEAKHNTPNLLRPKHPIKAYAIGFFLGSIVLLSAYFFYIWFGILTISSNNASLSFILIDFFGVFILSTCTSVFEELTFRGFLITRLEQKWNIHIVIIIQAILFGLMHAEQGFNMLWTTTLGGFVLGYLFINTRNLYAPIALHTSVHLLNILHSQKIFYYHYDHTNSNIYNWLGGGNLMGFVGQIGFLTLTIIMILRYLYRGHTCTFASFR